MFGRDHCAGVWAPRTVSLTTMSSSLIFSLVTVPANVLVILAVVLNSRKDLRVPFALLIANLAATDFLVGGLVEPLSVYIHYRESRGLPINMAWLSQTAYFLCCTASLLSLAVLTIDRYLAITRPVWYRASVSSRRVVVASVVVWISSMAITSLYYKFGFVAYAFVFANFAILSTFLIFVFTYVRVFHVLRTQIKNLKNLHGTGSSELEKAHRRSMNFESRITKTFLIILAVFLACYVPSCVMIHLMNLCTSCSCYLLHWFRDLQFILVTFNSLINPFIYATRLRNFRRAFGRILCKHPCCPGDPHIPGKDPGRGMVLRKSTAGSTSATATRETQLANEEDAERERANANEE